MSEIWQGVLILGRAYFRGGLLLVCHMMAPTGVGVADQCLGIGVPLRVQTVTLFRTDSPKIIYPVLGREGKTIPCPVSHPCIGHIRECSPS